MKGPPQRISNNNNNNNKYQNNTCAHGGIYSVNPNLVKIDYSSNINPLGTPKEVIRTIQKGIKSLAAVYPDPECKELKNHLSHHLRINPEWISVGNGAVEIIYWFVQTFVKNKKQVEAAVVVIPAPTFCEYELASYKAGANVISVPLINNNFELDADTIIKEAKGADAIFLCNPNNPTGVLSTKQIIEIIEKTEESTKIMLDECFIELVDNSRANTLLPKINEFSNLIILRSLTKSFGLAGLRIGYSICNPTLAKKIASNKVPWNVNGLAQTAAIAALQNASKYLAATRTFIKKERKFMHDSISKLKLFTVHKSDTNYFMIDLHNRDSTYFRDTLLNKTGILVRDCRTFTGMDTHHIRVAIKTHRENEQLLKALKMFDES
jgi:threonine-phosphate decarboxylase